MRAILEEDGRHPRTVEAAEFLVREAHGAPSQPRPAGRPGRRKGAGRPRARLRALAGDARMAGRPPGLPARSAWCPNRLIDTFLETMATSAANPMLRAKRPLRYLAAGTGLMRAANDPLMPTRPSAPRAGAGPRCGGRPERWSGTGGIRDPYPRRTSRRRGAADAGAGRSRSRRRHPPRDPGRNVAGADRPAAGRRPGEPVGLPRARAADRLLGHVVPYRASRRCPRFGSWSPSCPRTGLPCWRSASTTNSPPSPSS